MPRTTPKRIQASGHLVKIHKEADLGGEEWRVEVGEGKKAHVKSSLIALTCLVLQYTTILQ